VLITAYRSPESHACYAGPGEWKSNTTNASLGNAPIATHQLLERGETWLFGSHFALKTPPRRRAFAGIAGRPRAAAVTRVMVWRLLLVLGLVVASAPAGASSIYDVPPDCATYFHDACSPAIGAWLPRLPSTPGWAFDTKAAPTSVEDEIRDPAGRGPRTFGHLHAVVDGTGFVYGMAGPPRGSLVYDPVARIAFYDEGCCAWHDVVVASDVSPPPKHVVARSLVAIRTKRGIALGAEPSAVRAVFGAAALSPVPNRADERLLVYRKPLGNPRDSTCDESYAFLFRRERLVLIDYGAAC
jgi:hypothetical protein